MSYHEMHLRSIKPENKETNKTKANKKRINLLNLQMSDTIVKCQRYFN